MSENEKGEKVIVEQRKAEVAVSFYSPFNKFHTIMQILQIEHNLVFTMWHYLVLE